MFDLSTEYRTQNFEQSLPESLIFGTYVVTTSFPCSTKCSKSKNCKVPQTLRDFGTKKVSF